jgi:hypothetical protein
MPLYSLITHFTIFPYNNNNKKKKKRGISLVEVIIIIIMWKNSEVK